VVEEVLAELGLAQRETLLVFNKIDRLTHAEEQALRQRVTAVFDTPAVYNSAVEETGLAELRDALVEALRRQRPEVSVRLPAEDGEALAALYREGEVLDRHDDGGTIEIRARLPLPTLGRLRQRDGVAVSAVA
jgi:GTPase